MPHRYNPHGRISYPVEEAVGAYDDLAIGEIRKLRHDAARVREALQSAKDFLRVGAEAVGGYGIPAPNVRNRIKELCASGWREPDSHERSRASAPKPPPPAPLPAQPA